MTVQQRLQGLYLITDEALTPEDKLVSCVQQSILGGCRVLQYRDKRSKPDARRQQSRLLQALCRENNVTFIINDDINLACEIGADGIHLGRQDLDPKAARRQAGADAIIGISCYNNLDRAIDAERHGADYVAFGSFFPSGIKPDAVHAEINLLVQARQRLTIPIVAIGGITRVNGKELVDAGADMLAVISAVFGQNNIQNAAAGFQPLFTRSNGPGS